MANLHFTREVKTFGSARKEAWVTFTTANGSITVDESNGVVSCTRSDEGEFTIVLAETTKASKYQVSIAKEGTTAAYDVIVTDNDPSARTVELTSMAVADDTPDDNPGMTVHVLISMRYV